MMTVSSRTLGECASDAPPPYVRPDSNWPAPCHVLVRFHECGSEDYSTDVHNVGAAYPIGPPSLAVRPVVAASRLFET